MSLTMEEAMAMAVLKGDRAAAYALADKLIEEYNSPKGNKLREAVDARRRNSGFVDGYTVYTWPEFRAFAKRLGFIWEAPTIRLTITMVEGEAVEITHVYQGKEEMPQLSTPPIS